MNDQELQRARLQKWHLDGATVRTAEQGAAFLESVGFLPALPDASGGSCPHIRWGMGWSRRESTDLPTRLRRPSRR